MIEFSAAVQSVKVLGDILKAAHELKDSTALVSAVNDVHNKLSVAYESFINSQQHRSALQNRLTELEKELEEIKEWHADAENYQLTELCSGVFAFVTKPGLESKYPPHKICTACHSKRQKGYLQRTAFDGRGTLYKCDRCGLEILDHANKLVYPDLEPALPEYF